MIETTKVELDRKQARELYREYRKHQHYSAPVDAEIRRTYQLIAQGRVVIRALDSIVKAGLNEKRLPKLAIARADMPRCRLFARNSDGSATMSCDLKRAFRRSNSATSLWMDFPPGSFPNIASKFSAHESLVPEVPEHLRPKRGLANYHVLWEADWEPLVSADPLLLRRIGKADMWVVVAAWDLTPVEQAALQARVSS